MTEMTRTVIDRDRAMLVVALLKEMTQSPAEAIATLALAAVILDTINAQISGNQPRTLEQLANELGGMVMQMRPEGGH